MINKKQAVKNVFTNGVQFLVTLIYGIILPIIVLNKIGNQQYSIWVLIMAYSGFIRLLDLGSFNALTRYLSQEIDNKGEMYKYFSSIFVVILFSLIMVLVFMSIFLSFFSELLFPNLEYKNINIILISFLFIASINLLTDMFSNILKAEHRFDLINYSVILYSFLNIITIPLFLKISIDLSALMYSFFVSSIVRFLYVLYLVRKLHLEFEFSSLFYFNIQYFKKIFILSSSDQWIRGTTIFWSTFIKYLIQKQFGSQYLVAYDLSMRVVSQFSNFPNIVVSTLLPIFSSLNSKHEIDKIISTLKKIVTYLSIVILPIMLYIIFFSEKIIYLWTGQDNSIISLTISILLISNFINILTSPIYYATLAFGKPKPGIKKTLIALFSNIIIVTISSLFELGYDWIIFAEFISTIISVGYFIHIFDVDYKVNIMKFIIRDTAKIIFCILPLILILFVFEYWIHISSDIAFLIITLVIYILIVFFVYSTVGIIGNYEIDLVRNHLFNHKKGN